MLVEVLGQVAAAVKLMFSTFTLCAFKGVGGKEEMFNIYGLQYVVDILGTVALLFSAYLFYRFGVLQLSQTSYKNVKVNWRLFSIPPAYG